MITRIVKLEILSEKAADFRKTFAENHHKIESFPGCKEVRLVHAKDNENTHFTISLWESEQALESYRHSELFGVIWPTVKPWFKEKAEAWTTISF